MLKYVLLATSVAIASPAFAQDAPAAETTVPAPATPAPDQAPPEADPAAPAQDAAGTTEAATDTTAAAQPAPAQPSAPAEATAAAQPAPAEQPATNESQVAQVVNTEFATYDLDKDGALNKAEFDTWMNTLRKAAEPAYIAESPAGKTWLTQAFTQADTDKNAKINAVELTAFLTPKPAS
jgi:hypothetical protein